MKKINDSSEFPKRHRRKGSIIFSRNGHGEYAKGYVKPTDAKTPYQIKNRITLAWVSEMWRSLSYQQVTVWNDSALMWGIVNKKKTGILTGCQLFSQMNLNIINAGGIPNLDCPHNLELPQHLTSAKVEIISKPGKEDILLTFTPNLDELNFIIVSATSVLRCSSMPDEKSYRRIGVIDKSWNPGISPKSIKGMYMERFGRMIENGESVAFKFQVVEVMTGQASNARYCIAMSND